MRTDEWLHDRERCAPGPPTDSKTGWSCLSHEFGRIIPLDGPWQLGQGGMETPPKEFPSVAPVPGLVHLARPTFAEVGLPSARRQAFWYRRTFALDEDPPEAVRLKIGKAMFGAKVFLNGKPVAENWISFSPTYADLAGLVKGKGETNELVVRVGAHIENLPPTVCTGGEIEKAHYIPGIFDKVELLLSGNPYVVRAQVVPASDRSEARVAVWLANAGRVEAATELRANVYEWQSGKRAGSATAGRVRLKAGERRTIDLSVPIAGARLWSPEHPFLYVLELTDGRYTYRTRFGMRSFRLDPAYTNRALLNGKTYFLRGTTFCLLRFFDDPLCRDQPWDRAWVRKLFRRFTAMEMNACRFCISAMPDMWYDLADEEGMIVEDEYPIWYAYRPGVSSGDMSAFRADPKQRYGIWPEKLQTRQLVEEYTRWVQEHCNHPSVCLWDAQNETWSLETGEAINQVRGLDLSGQALGQRLVAAGLGERLPRGAPIL